MHLRCTCKTLYPCLFRAIERVDKVWENWDSYDSRFLHVPVIYSSLYNNQINARAMIGQSAMSYCAGKPIEKSGVFWIIT